MQEFLSEYQSVKQRFQKLAETEEYQKKCRHYLSEIDRLTIVADSLLVQIPQYRTVCETDIVHRQYASGCKYLHRGFYAPSPVIERVVVGVKRGKLLKRLSARCKPSFEYGFNAEGQLLRSKQLLDHQVISTEYLFYQENKTYGITIDSNGSFQTVTEELFENDTLIRYTKADFAPFSELYCYRISCEEYHYNTESLHMDWHQLMPPLQELEFLPEIEPLPYPVYRCNSYDFVRKGDQLIFANNIMDI